MCARYEQDACKARSAVAKGQWLPAVSIDTEWHHDIENWDGGKITLSYPIKTRTYCLSASKLQAEITSRNYINGFSTYADWCSTENDYITSQIALLESKKVAAQSRAKWDNFLGKSFTNGKRKINEKNIVNFWGFGHRINNNDSCI